MSDRIAEPLLHEPEDGDDRTIARCRHCGTGFLLGRDPSECLRRLRTALDTATAAHFRDLVEAKKDAARLEVALDAATRERDEARALRLMQPIHIAPDGVARFRANPLVRYLLDHGGLDMNNLAIWAAGRSNVTDDDRAQFAQLIGYSVSGYGDLSYATRIDEADAIVEAIVNTEEGK